MKTYTTGSGISARSKSGTAVRLSRGVLGAPHASLLRRHAASLVVAAWTRKSAYTKRPPSDALDSPILADEVRRVSAWPDHLALLAVI